MTSIPHDLNRKSRSLVFQTIRAFAVKILCQLRDSGHDSAQSGSERLHFTEEKEQASHFSQVKVYSIAAIYIYIAASIFLTIWVEVYQILNIISSGLHLVPSLQLQFVECLSLF